MSEKATRRAVMIARDHQNLLRRVANIYPGPGGGMNPGPGGGGYAGPGGGKYIGPSRYAEGGKVEPTRAENTKYGLVYVNPTKRMLKAHFDKAREHEQRLMAMGSVPPIVQLAALRQGPNVYVWHGMDATHDDMAPLLGIDKLTSEDRHRFTRGDAEAADYDIDKLTTRPQRASGGKIPPFKLHSGAAKLIAQKGQAKATPQQYAALPGIKPDELKHAKFDTLPAKAQPREEVIKHLEANTVPLQETVLGKPDFAAHAKKALQSESDYFNQIFQDTHGREPNSDREMQSFAERVMRERHDEEPLEGGARYANAIYNLPGGKNYREVLLHLPEGQQTSRRMTEIEQLLDKPGADDATRLALRREYQTLADESRDRDFHHDHWEQPNVLAHLRMADRAGPNGEKVLHVEEVQSDWGQQGRKRGFKTKEKEPPRLSVGRLGNGNWEVYNETHGRTAMDEDGNEAIFPTEREAHAMREQLLRDPFEAASAVPHGPYVDNTQKWTDLALKRVLHEAAHGGYDKVIFTPGEAQNERWPGHDLAKYYDEILPKRLQALAQQHDPKAKVAIGGHTLGPSMRVVNSKAPGYFDVVSDAGFHGSFYDEKGAHEYIADNAMDGPALHSLDVTPQMRDSIKANGFSQFKRGGEVGMRHRYAAGGSADSPAVSKALDLVSMFQSGHPMAAPAAAPSPMRNTPTAPGSMSIKSLSDAFQAAIAHHTSLPPEQRAANSRAAAEKLATYMGKTKSGMPPALLTKNAKLMKSEAGYKGGQPITLPDGRGVETTGLALAPAYQEGKFTTCPNASSCKAECLGKFSGGYFFAGGGQDPDALKGPRLNSARKTQAMLREPEAFAVRLHDEIEAAKRMAAMNNNMLGVRLNVLSDINPRVHKPIFEAHPDVAFYDYTKNNTNPVAPNHHYTYSSTGVSDNDVDNPHSNWKQMRKRLDTGSNVAMAFSHKEQLPETVYDEETGKTYKVVNGDSHDFRPLDIQPRGADGVIVGLRNKKANSKNESAHKTSNGFFVRHDPQYLLGNRGTRVKGPDGKPIPQNTQVRIKSQRAAPMLKTNDEAEAP